MTAELEEPTTETSRALFATYTVDEPYSDAAFLSSNFAGSSGIVAERKASTSNATNLKYCYQVLRWVSGVPQAAVSGSNSITSTSETVPFALNPPSTNIAAWLSTTISYGGLSESLARVDSTIPSAISVVRAAGLVGIRIVNEYWRLPTGSSNSTFYCKTFGSLSNQEIVQLPGLVASESLLIGAGWLQTYGSGTGFGSLPSHSSAAVRSQFVGETVELFRSETSAAALEYCFYLIHFGSFSVPNLPTTIVNGSSIDQAFPGNVVVTAGSTLVTQSAASTSVVGTLSISATAALTVQGVSDSGTLTVVTAGGIQGVFEKIEATTVDACQTAQVTNAVYSPTTLSVSVNVQGSPCGGQVGAGLSTGAIVGIAIGALVVAVLLVLLIVLLFKYQRRAYTNRANLEIQMRNN